MRGPGKGFAATGGVHFSSIHDLDAVHTLMVRGARRLDRLAQLTRATLAVCARSIGPRPQRVSREWLLRHERDAAKHPDEE